MIPHNYSLIDVFNRIRKTAETGIHLGDGLTPYLRECTWFLEKFACTLVFSRDAGHHTCGWWKNPDYERCYHLSLSWRAGRNKNAFNTIIISLFGRNKKLIWTEGPFSDVGKKNGVWHYRVFCDENWKPIMPRGEVYNKRYTERGWKSFSDLHGL